VVHQGVFYPARVTPYFQDPRARPLRRALERGDRAAALRAAENALAQQAPHPERLSFVLAWLLHRARRYAEAAPIFEGLRQSYPVLAQGAAYFAARCYYHLGLLHRARRLVRPIKAPGALARRAVLLRGDVERGLGDWAAAARTYRSFVQRHAGAPGTAEARVRLAESVVAHWPRAPRDLRRAARRALRQGLVDSPTGPWGRRARALLSRHAAQLMPAAGGRATVPCDARLARIEAWARRGRLTRALRRFRRGRWGHRQGCSARRLCRASAALGRRLARKRRLRGRALPVLRQARRACRRAKQTDRVVKTTYALAKTLAREGKPRAALRWFARVERRHRGHSYADDARMHRSRLLRELKGDRAADRLLQTLPKRYPRGDRQHDALWTLAWAAYQRGALRDALRWLTRSTGIQVPPEREEDVGRDAYWRARVLARLGRGAEAERAWAALARAHPLTWYALLSLNQLRRRAPERAHGILASWRPGPARPWPRFGPDAKYRTRRFARAVEYARLGLGGLTAQELRDLGIVSPVRLLGATAAAPPGAVSASAMRKRQLARARRQRLWAAAVLYHRAGLHHKSHWMVRHALRDYAAKPPRGTNRARWRLSYPRAHPARVVAHARRHGLSPSLVWGLMREESAFNPRLVSHANAVGLMQLLTQTARRFRGEDRRPITPAALKRPGRNIPIGTRYLGWLRRQFEGQVLLAVAAYNAGETRVFSWVRARGSQPPDHFAEEIPFRETRRYVKRVLGSAFAYAVLEGASDPLFRIPAVFPPKLMVKARRWQRRTRRWLRRKRQRQRRRNRRRHRPRPAARRR
jgi:soluble lytic murein transglycosylase